MKTIAVILSSALLLAVGTSAFAADERLVSRSAGKLQQDQSVDLSAELKLREPLSRARPSQSENYTQSPTAARLAGTANRHDQLFEIYTADVRLLGDLDEDGYYHALRVVFDVDVNYDSATVYAKLYLSREGEPWSQYFTTDLFQIHADDVADTYEVETELLEGYPPGYYSVLVEIYSLDHAYMVASEVLDYYYLGKDLTIEDLSWDDSATGYYGESYTEVHYSSHGGSIGWLLAFFLIIQVVIAARGALALIPCKNSDEKKKNSSPALRSCIEGD